MYNKKQSKNRIKFMNILKKNRFSRREIPQWVQLQYDVGAYQG